MYTNISISVQSAATLNGSAQQQQQQVVATKQAQESQSNNGQSNDSQTKPPLEQAQVPQAPTNTFERTSFEQLLAQYDQKHDLPPTVELTQAFLMTQNMKETAGRVHGLTAGGSAQNAPGSGYFYKNDYVGDSMRLADAMQSVSRLLGNLGTSDKASNFLIEQRRLMRAHAKENRLIRDMIEDKIVDGMEYVRVKEKIAETKSRVQQLLDERFTSDEENILTSIQQDDSHISNNKSEGASETQEDSQEAARNRKITEMRIISIIKQLRQDAREYLSLRDGYGGESADQLPLTRICEKLRMNKRYRKKREQKAIQKGIVDTLQSTAEHLRQELKHLERETSTLKPLNELKRLVSQYEQVMGVEKRVNSDVQFDKTVAEIDSLPMNQKSFEIQNILFNFCGVDLEGNRKNDIRDIFGRVKKLRAKSTLLASYQDHNDQKTGSSNENGPIQKAKKNDQEIVKVIGLDPEKLLQRLDKYRVRIDRMPKFSNVFDRAEPIIPGIGMTVAGSLIAANQGGQMTFARIDGRNVISLQFNPYEIEDPSKKKQYEQAMKEIVDQREKIKSISKQAREKQEASNIKRAWLNIVKKDLPKAFRQYQKYKADMENNNKKQSQNCLKEVRKKVIKTQRLAKENVMRAKRLTKDMMNYWKKRDKEIADLKRKKDKVEKEMRRRQEEEREALLQKKRLEFIMQQSEIYAHFMSKKLGLAEEQQKQRQQDLEEESKDQFRRVDIDEGQARQNVAQMINENLNRVVVFDHETNTRKHHQAQILQVNDDELEVDKFDQQDTSHSTVQAPRCFLGNLKEYQLKGLRWLDNLYEQGINGILADEMGLGKTIQAIALLAHLYENKQVWGPFLVIVPVTTLHNWQNELSKFCPQLKVLPYFGSPEERKKLGKFLDPKNLYNPNTRINVLLTSYNLIVNSQKDQQKLLRVKWHYMILDEAQAIKNNLSRRWRVLLQFTTRNRLLLTGTPIQNSMAELWALLHFIMPKLFDSHEQFQEWFSKDIENHSFNNQGEINKHQLRRLHLVLKPFMLRRLKKDVEAEIGPKVEHDILCEMTHRQRVLYQRIKNKISTKDLFQLVDSKAKMENLMNLVMQFRKVCNHPELFERRVGRIPFSFARLQHGMQTNPNFSSVPDLRPQVKNPIVLEIPKIIWDECFLISDNMTKLFTRIRKDQDIALSEVSLETHMRFFNIFNPLYLSEQATQSNSNLSILRLMTQGNQWSFSNMSYLFVADPLIKQIALMHFYHQKYHRRFYNAMTNDSSLHFNHLQIGQDKGAPIDLNIVDFINRDPMTSNLYRTNRVYELNGKGPLVILPPLITDDLNTFANYSRQLRSDLDIYVSTCVAEPINFYCKSGTFKRFTASLFHSSMHKKALIGHNFKPQLETHLGRIGRDRSSFLQLDAPTSFKNGPPTGYNLLEQGIIGDVIIEKGASILELPNYSRLVTDCAKMQFLDKLLMDLHRNNHRCLIFCQMTRMLDILEDFLCWRKYTYFRMDGSTTIQDRRYMVEEYQKNPDIFAFLLSTRAGGLGVNLIAADTVIFYDNDWNPTMDAQATDRAHRIGQTKTVNVYRIITKKTVEEKIVKRAKQKQTVQSTVYGGGSLKADVFKPKDVVDMLLDEQEEKDLKERGAKFLKSKRMKKFFGGREHGHHDEHTQRDDEHPGSTSVTKPLQINSQTLDKKTPTPSKAAVKKVEKAEKPAKEAAAPKQKKEKPAKQPMNIFSTVKSTPGPFAVTKATSQQQSSSTPVKQTDQDEYDNEEDYEEEDEEMMDEDAIKAQKLLRMIESGEDEEGEDEDEDDDEGLAFEYAGGDEIDKPNPSVLAMMEEEDEDAKKGGSGKKGDDEEMDDY